MDADGVPDEIHGWLGPPSPRFQPSAKRCNETMHVFTRMIRAAPASMQFPPVPGWPSPRRISRSARPWERVPALRGRFSGSLSATHPCPSPLASADSRRRDAEYTTMRMRSAHLLTVNEEPPRQQVPGRFS
jgi:hypothetical protein